MGTNDYAPYLSRIRSEVDAMFVFLFGSDAIRLIKQYREYGLKEKIPLLGKDITDEMILNQIGDNAVGIITAQCYSTALDTPANKAFMLAYKKAYGREPTFYAENGYTGAKVIIEALRAVKGNVEDKTGFLKALREVKLDETPRGPIRFDTYQNVVCATYIRKVEKVGGQYQNTVIETIPNVSQFWKWSPEEYLKTTRYTR
jgi:branched-chain amino acid transport system substrate-binding protein